MAEKLFNQKATPPVESELKEALGSSYFVLGEIRKFIQEEIGPTREEWKYYGKKYGWALKTFLKKRNLFFVGIYEGYFVISFIFGTRTEEAVLSSDVSDSLKEELRNSRKYAEGKSLQIDVFDEVQLQSIRKLIRLKVAH